ncbi:MAG: hypothetical protein COC08_04355 [Maribacter sp.]|nr:MAG: hypothetical protein COC08_04355 [Maribacter sp.]
MISCDKAVIICNKTQYEEASFWEKIKLKLHILFCSTCAVFSKKNTQFTVLCKKAHLHNLSEEDKNNMKKQVQGKL